MHVVTDSHNVQFCGFNLKMRNLEHTKYVYCDICWNIVDLGLSFYDAANVLMKVRRPRLFQRFTQRRIVKTKRLRVALPVGL